MTSWLVHSRICCLCALFPLRVLQPHALCSLCPKSRQHAPAVFEPLHQPEPFHQPSLLFMWYSGRCLRCSIWIYVALFFPTYCVFPSLLLRSSIDLPLPFLQSTQYLIHLILFFPAFHFPYQFLVFLSSSLRIKSRTLYSSLPSVFRHLSSASPGLGGGTGIPARPQDGNTEDCLKQSERCGNVRL